MSENSPRPPAEGSEKLQVALELPRGDLLVGGLDLAALDLDELVDVGAPPQRWPGCRWREPAGFPDRAFSEPGVHNGPAALPRTTLTCHG
jgi:hypothetical protein